MEARIPVDVCNPGQVFACLGFMEATSVLLGHAEGGFDWSGQSTCFVLRTDCGANPFGAVLAFLAGADILQCAPVGYTEATAEKTPKKRPAKTAPVESGDETSASEPTEFSEMFPGPKANRMALPIRLVGTMDGQPLSITLSHWADASSRSDFKLYAGNRSAARIAHAMLLGNAKSQGVRALWHLSHSALEQMPFDVLSPMGGSFNLDPRGRWTAIDAGYSPDEQRDLVLASPVVELLAAVGLEHARPQESERAIRYGVWSGLLPPTLARVAITGIQLGGLMRTFQFQFGGTKHNKVVTFAEEENSA